jgi:Mg-chelatase subunit ChlD
MPSAIQRVSSEVEEIECFEQDTSRLESEHWVIIFDCSASMSVRFEEMKKFIFYLAETAERINHGGAKWGLFSFNNNFTIVKDHKENYNQTVKARIGGMKTSGMSFIADAIDMGTKILSHDSNSQYKYLIIVSDGRPLGTETNVQRSLERAHKQKINLIGIGTPDNMKKPCVFSIDYFNSKKSVKKFINAYTNLVESG